MHRHMSVQEKSFFSCIYRFCAEIIDMKGRLLKKINVLSSSTLDMESYPEGIYVLRLIRNGGEDHIKILKN